MSFLSKWVSLALIGPLFLIAGCTDRNALLVLNESTIDIVVVNAKVNEQVISEKELFIASSPQRYSPVPIYASWEGNSPKLIEISLTYKIGEGRAKCTLNDESKSCLIKAIYVGTPELRCVCDTYSDFKY